MMRLAQVALLLNAAMAAIAGIGFVAGFAPHAAEHAVLARRVAAGELAGAFIFAFTATRLRKDARLIALPMAFVFFNLVVSIYEFAVRRTTGDLAPAVEGIFFSIYAAFFAANLRHGQPGGR